MRRTLIFGALLLSLSLSSCQCASPPPMSPVEDEGQAQLVPPDTEHLAPLLRAA